MVGEVSAQNLEAIVRRPFGLRNAPLAEHHQGRQKGIGAARNWVEGEFKKYAATSGGASP
jgi:hypothetical protein